MLWNKNKIAFDAVNIECNPGLLKRKDGSLASQCECMFSAIRHDGGKPWMMLLELKYCLPKNRMDNVAYALGQLKKTYNFLRDEKSFLPPEGVKPYFVISTPDCEAIAPFEDCFLDQDELLSIKEDFDGAQVYHTNAIEILTAKHLRNKKEESNEKTDICHTHVTRNAHSIAYSGLFCPYYPHYSAAISLRIPRKFHHLLSPVQPIFKLLNDNRFRVAGVLKPRVTPATKTKPCKNNDTTISFLQGMMKESFL